MARPFKPNNRKNAALPTTIPEEIKALTTIPKIPQEEPPSLWTTERCQQIVDLLLRGSTLKNAAWRAGVAPEVLTNTLFYCKKSLSRKQQDTGYAYLSFMEKFTIACYAAQAFYIDTMVGKAMGAVDKMAMAWPAVFRRFESEHPEDWAQKQETTQNINQKVEFVVTRLDGAERVKAIEAPKEEEESIEAHYLDTVEDF